tara:strand:- start:9209 stop:9790 length:582 start_codon:yes stop_codon:yes gene_type:complete
MFKPIEIENVIEKDYQKQILDVVTDITFDWHFMEDTTFEKTDTLNNSTPSFANLVYHPNNKENPGLEFFTPLLQNTCAKAGLELDQLLRMRLGFLLNTKYMMPHVRYQYNTPHVDFEQDHYTACYYINECDGETVVFHETEEAEKYKPMHKSMPQQGKVLVFNGKHYHASTCPKMFTKRIVMTMNFTARQING